MACKSPGQLDSSHPWVEGRRTTVPNASGSDKLWADNCLPWLSGGSDGPDVRGPYSHPLAVPVTWDPLSPQACSVSECSKPVVHHQQAIISTLVC